MTRRLICFMPQTERITNGQTCMTASPKRPMKKVSTTLPNNSGEWQPSRNIMKNATGHYSVTWKHMRCSGKVVSPSGNVATADTFASVPKHRMSARYASTHKATLRYVLKTTDRKGRCAASNRNCLKARQIESSGKEDTR